MTRCHLDDVGAWFPPTPAPRLRIDKLTGSRKGLHLVTLTRDEFTRSDRSKIKSD